MTAILLTTHHRRRLGETPKGLDLERQRAGRSSAAGNGDDEGEADEADVVATLEEGTPNIAGWPTKAAVDITPMVIVPTDEEVAAMAMVVRDAKGEIIDEKHSNTFPWITRFEKARVIGTRAAQLSHGAPPQIKVPDGLIDSMKIAEIEP